MNKNKLRITEQNISKLNQQYDNNQRPLIIRKGHIVGLLPRGA